MKYLEKITQILMVSWLLLSGCTNQFDELNVSPNALQQDRFDEDLLFTRTLVYGALRYTEFQRAQHLYCNHYIQYYSMSVGRFPTGRYITRDDWLTAYWTEAYADYLTQCQQVINITIENPKLINKTAMARIWKVFLFHRITDFFGDVPYFEALQGNLTPRYDPQKDIYADMLNELEEAADSFDPSLSSTLGFGEADILYQGNIDHWVRFANSLQFRLSMRMSEVDPAGAEQHIRELLGEDRLINSEEFSAVMSYGEDFGGALENLQPMGIIRTFNEYRASNTLVDFLRDNNDPRLELYIAPSEATNEFAGLTNGLNPEELAAIDDQLDNFARDSHIISNTYAPSVLLSYSEVELLKAEASLRGWGSGSVQTHYENGIRASINFWLDVYQNLLVRIPTSQQNILPTISVSMQDINDYLSEPNILYNPANALEQIITQKWLTNINQGFESYADYRRTGFPKLNPIPNTDMQSETGGSAVPLRIRYPSEEQSLNGENYRIAVGRQGPDLPTTSVWWDTQ
ncbi:MAG: SusD/RagB family nutrient-binding outer membrane lipoprotein [Ekhidna sp.]|nr:SusD/RagB family nutrient-binding outer membrane lipoprotein [Ekhidna sp.]